MTMGMKMMAMMMLFNSNPVSINGKTMDMERIDEIVKAGDTEVWTIRNSSIMAHPFHIHNAQFEIIEKESGISEHETGYKDTILIPGNNTIKVLIDFPVYKDEKLPYMYHCHILEHEDDGMMGQFITV